jgi:bacterioferritin
MQPNPKVLQALEDVLQAEIAAINSYFIHAKLLGNWGYMKLSTKAYEESMDEMRHTEQLVDRITASSTSTPSRT